MIESDDEFNEVLTYWKRHRHRDHIEPYRMLSTVFRQLLMMARNCLDLELAICEVLNRSVERSMWSP